MQIVILEKIQASLNPLLSKLPKKFRNLTLNRLLIVECVTKMVYLGARYRDQWVNNNLWRGIACKDKLILLPFAPDIRFFHWAFSYKWQHEPVKQENSEYFQKNRNFLVYFLFLVFLYWSFSMTKFSMVLKAWWNWYQHDEIAPEF